VYHSSEAISGWVRIYKLVGYFRGGGRVFSVVRIFGGLRGLSLVMIYGTDQSALYLRAHAHTRTHTHSLVIYTVYTYVTNQVWFISVCVYIMQECGLVGVTENRTHI
jgi:hypothetical protein